MKQLFILVLILIFIGIFNTACHNSKSNIVPYQTIEQYINKNFPDTEPTQSGMYLIKEQCTSNEPLVAGDWVKVHYTGYLIDSTVFDSSLKRNEAFEFQLGTNSVIPGWEEAISLMKVGEKATAIIPSYLGYGSSANGSIPANADLIFSLEIVDSHK